MRVKTDFDGCFGDSVPEIVLNLNEILPRNCPFYMIGVFEVLNDLLAYSVDLVGNEKYQLYVIDLKTKNTLAGPVKDTYYSAQWKLVGTELFLYFNIVSERWGVPLAIQSIGPFSASKSPVLSSVYEEQDIAFICELYGTNDGQALFIKINDQTTSEYVEIEHTSSGIVLKPIFKRSVGVKYFVEHFQNSYVIQTNENAPNFKVLVYSKSMTLETEKVAVSDDFIEKVEVFEKYFVLWIRRNSFPFIKVCEVEGRACKEYPSEIDGKPYTLAPNFELDIDARVYRSYKSNSLLFSNSSFSQDTQLYYLNLSTMTTQWLIQVNSEDAVEYHEEQLFANSTTNFPIPISVIYPKDAIKPMPLMMIAYGAYGGFIDPSFAIEMYPFLKRGYMWAICHPRGTRS
jgi:oligopeptidase B